MYVYNVCFLREIYEKILLSIGLSIYTSVLYSKLFSNQLSKQRKKRNGTLILVHASDGSTQLKSVHYFESCRIHVPHVCRLMFIYKMAASSLLL